MIHFSKKKKPIVIRTLNITTVVLKFNKPFRLHALVNIIFQIRATKGFDLQNFLVPKYKKYKK